MDLCQGDITRKDEILWNVTLEEAIEWVAYIVKRRYEWIELVGKMLGGEAETGTDKKCRNVRVCSICRKQCNQRLQ